MLAVVVLISALIGLLVGAVQVSRQMQKWLIKEMKVGGGAGEYWRTGGK
jgi:type III secretory pathway component EscS